MEATLSTSKTADHEALVGAAAEISILIGETAGRAALAGAAVGIRKVRGAHSLVAPPSLPKQYVMQAARAGPARNRGASARTAVTMAAARNHRHRGRMNSIRILARLP